MENDYDIEGLRKTIKRVNEIDLLLKGEEIPNNMENWSIILTYDAVERLEGYSADLLEFTKRLNDQSRTLNIWTRIIGVSTILLFISTIVLLVRTFTS